MENNKCGWRKNNNSFEKYYYNQLNRFKKAVLIFSADKLTEDSSLEEISKRFDELIDFLEVAKNARQLKHSIIPEGLCSDSYKYQTAIGVEQELAIEKLNNMLKERGFFPIEKTPTENKVLVIDINYLPSEYKSKDNLYETRETLETIYNCKVILVDGSRMNTQGLSNNYLPVYFI